MSSTTDLSPGTFTDQSLLEKPSQSARKEFISNFFEILGSIVPTSAYMVAQFALALINYRFVAKNCSTIEVDGVGLGGTWLVATYLSFVFGLNSGTSTYAAQSFGAGNMEMIS